MQTKVNPFMSRSVEKYYLHNTKREDIRIRTDVNELQGMIDLNQFNNVFSGHSFHKKVVGEL